MLYTFGKIKLLILKLTTMKKLILLAAFSYALTFLCVSQNNIYQYSYDQSGNRVLRLHIPARIANPKDEPEAYSQKAKSNLITVFPNPNRGKMEVRIDNLENTQNATVKIYATNGSFIKEYKNAQNSTSINIEDKPAGNYIISVGIDKVMKEWVVMKE